MRYAFAPAAVMATAAICLLAMAHSALAQEGDADAGKKVFAKCQACHTVEAGKNKVGPSLHGVVGRKSGSIEGFAYSDAMKKADVTWDETTLDHYLTNPRKMVPGTKMIFPGLPKAEDRANVIAYLKQAGAQ
jgi:cytochrome c